MTFRRAACAAGLSGALLLLPRPAGAGEAPGAARDAAKGRWHFRFEAAPAFEISVLFRRGASGDETRLLVDGGALGRFVLVSEQEPSGRGTRESVAAVGPAGAGGAAGASGAAGTGDALRRRLLLPGTEMPPGCRGTPERGGYDPEGAGCVIFEGNGTPVAAPLPSFSGPSGEALRGRARALAPGSLAGRLEGLASLFPRSVEFDAYGDDFLWLAWPEWRARFARRAAEPGTRSAGCAFDAGFGFPCSPRELEAERARFPGR